MPAEADPRLLVPLTAAQAVLPSEVGFKAANLIRLATAGLNVPPGFCVTAEAYEEHVFAPAVSGSIRSTLDGAKGSSPEDRRALLAKLRSDIVGAPASARLARQIEDACHALGASRVAVRSSATMEDLPGHSFAGMYDTFLGVSEPATVVSAVKKCWASLWTERAFEYREKNGLDHANARMAVVVQRLVDSEASGVLFTADPVTGRTDRVLVEAVFGLGEGLVSGKISPDRIVLAKDGLRVLEHTIADKTMEVVASGNGSLEQTIAPPRAKSPCLSDAAARQLGGLVMKVEAAFGAAQDIEWALAGGQIFILQSRPVTTLPARSLADRQVWSNLNTGEVVPDVVTPITWSYLQPAIESLFDMLLGRFGFRLAGHPLLGLVAGRAYFNLNTFVGIMRSLPGFRNMDTTEMWGGKAGSGPHFAPEDVPEFDFRLSRFLTGLPSFCLWFMSHSTYRGLLFATAMRREARAMEAGNRTDLSEQAIASRLHALLAQAERVMEDAIAFGGTGAMYTVSLLTLCRKWLNDTDASLAHGLLAGQGNMESAEAGLDQWRLAVLAHAHPEVERTLIDCKDFRAARTMLPGAAGGPEFLSAWDEFMDHHGHHARGEIEFFNPRWRDMPDALLDTVRGYLRAIGTLDPLATHRRCAVERRRLTVECRRRLRNPLKRLIFNFVLSNAQRGCLVRENVKSEAVRWMARGRNLLLQLGDRFQRRGLLESADDIFFLNLSELEPVRLGKADFDVRAAIASRRAEYKRNLELEPPQVVVGSFDPDRFTPEVIDTNARMLTGVAVSPGVATGPARVILRADVDEQVLPGEILVAPFTDPGWTPYFLRAAAIVMDQGGLLSHGSIIAREYGIPAVVNVGPATRIVRTGQMLRVDGSRGQVTLVGDAQFLTEAPAR
jgi:rifampicin phosphotransferase